MDPPVLKVLKVPEGVQVVRGLQVHPVQRGKEERKGIVGRQDLGGIYISLWKF